MDNNEFKVIGQHRPDCTCANCMPPKRILTDEEIKYLLNNGKGRGYVEKLRSKKEDKK